MSLSARRLIARRRSTSTSSSTNSSTSSTTGSTITTPPPYVHPHPYRLQPTLVPLSLSLSSLPRRSHLLASSASQEYEENMYKLDLGMESPYLGIESVLLRVPEMIVEEEEGEEEGVGAGAEEEGEEESIAPRNMDCRMCLKRAISRVRTRCCHTVVCRGHIDEWLEREESKGLCPMCDKPCGLLLLLPLVPSQPATAAAAPSSPRPSSPSPRPPSLPPLSVSACRSTSSSTRSTSSTLVEGEGWWEPSVVVVADAEETWDVKVRINVKELVLEESMRRRVAGVVWMMVVLFVLLR